MTTPEPYEQTVTSSPALRQAKATVRQLMKEAIGATPDRAQEPSTTNFLKNFAFELIHGDEHSPVALLRALLDFQFDRAVAVLYHDVKEKEFPAPRPRPTGSAGAVRHNTPSPAGGRHVDAAPADPPRVARGVVVPPSTGAANHVTPLPAGGPSGTAGPVDPIVVTPVQPRGAAARLAAVASATMQTMIRCRWLDEIMIQGRPARLATKRQALEWCAHNEARAAFIRRLAEALPSDDAVIGDCWTDADALAISGEERS